MSYPAADIIPLEIDIVLFVRTSVLDAVILVAKELAIVVAKLASSLIASASSLSVLSVAGAELTRFATAVSV